LYRNEPTVYNGFRYDSAKEAQFARDLDLSRHAQGLDESIPGKASFGFPWSSTTSPSVTWLSTSWFAIRDGRVELVEIKSPATQTPLFKLKVLEATWLQDHPEIDYRIQT
jgi:hypothetical protein